MLTGKECKICRTILGYTQQQMADAMFITKQSISDIETGKTIKQSSILFYQLVIEKLAKDNSDLQKYLDCIAMLKQLDGYPRFEA